MSLRLPEPLPYDYVDKMIEQTYKFTHDVWTDNDGIEWETHHCRFRNPTKHTSTFPRSFFNTIPLPEYHFEEDEEGYVDGTDLNFGFYWRAEPLTEDEFEFVMDDLG